MRGRRRGSSSGNEETGASGAPRGAVRGPAHGGGRDAERTRVAKLPAPAAEKSRYCRQRPYRKPTQVDGVSNLRPAGEALLRNSAKMPRNFGRRGAGACRPQRNGPSNCLAKTQVYAKPEGDVYGLTPARCWKVKGSAQRERRRELKPQ